MTLKTCTCLLLVAAAATPLANAEVLTVGLPGTGADFDSITAALAQANSGDAVLVGPGTFSEPSTLTLDRSIQLVGAGPDATTVVVPAEQFVVVWVRDLAANERCAISDMQLGVTMSPFVGSLGSRTVLVQDCVGPVALRNLEQSSLNGIPESAVEVENSSFVTIEGSVFKGESTFKQNGKAALLLNQANVSLTQVELTGGTGAGSVFAFAPAPALDAEESVIRVQDSVIRGGAGDAASGGFTAGQTSMTLTGSSVFLRGSTTLQGGSGILGQTALIVSPGNLVTWTPSVSFVAGVDSGGGTSQPDVVESGGIFLPLKEELATLNASNGAVAPGGAFTLEQGGAPLSSSTIYIGSLTAPFEIAGVLGPAFLQLAGLIELPTAPLDPQGSSTVTLSVPATSSLVGLDFGIQALQVSPAPTLSLSAPVSLTIVP
jgi:hypothetical protein